VSLKIQSEGSPAIFKITLPESVRTICTSGGNNADRCQSERKCQSREKKRSRRTETIFARLKEKYRMRDTRVRGKDATFGAVKAQGRQWSSLRTHVLWAGETVTKNRSDCLKTNFARDGNLLLRRERFPSR